MNRMTIKRGLLSALVLIAASLDAISQDTSQSALKIPERDIPIPGTVSSQTQQAMAQSLPDPEGLPKTTEEWRQYFLNPQWEKVLGGDHSAQVAQALSELRQRYDVKVEPRTIAGVNCFIVTPNLIPRANRRRLLVHVHGGGYMSRGGELGTEEAIRVGGSAHMKVVSIDFRLAPQFPYPAAMDDAMAVWSALVKTTKPTSMAIFGSSSGGGMTLAMIQRAKEQGLPLPGAIAVGTPWSDLTKTGDTYFTNAYLDRVLRTYEGPVEAQALLYANGHDLKDPHLSPVYGRFDGFPAAILASGTRDLYLSNTVRVYQKLLEAGVESQLLVFEGLSHGDSFAFSPDDRAPETRLALKEIARFFDRHLTSN